MKRRALFLAAAVTVAGILHAVSGRALAAADPIAALLEHRGAGVVAAAICVGFARLFLLFVAPGWAAHLALMSAARWRHRPPK